MTRSLAVLSDRGVVRASGADVAPLLDNLITNDLSRTDNEAACHSALLTPQGKIQFAFFVVNAGCDYYLEVARDRAADLAKRLTFYKLRARATFADISADIAVVAAWGEAATTAPGGILTYEDPRHAELGMRLILPAARTAELGMIAATEAAYHTHRIGCGVPEEIRDYPLGDTFPHEADFDLFHGVSFTKGCYVGQEVVSRMQNKTVVRKRVVRIEGSELVSGSEIKHGAGVIGTVGSVADTGALAMVRLDRVVEAAARGEPVTCNDQPITIDPAALARYRESIRTRPMIDL